MESVNPMIRVFAWLLVAAWIVLTLYLWFGPERIWWAPLVCLVWAGPALLYVLPAGKRNNTRRDHIVFRSTVPDDPPDPADGGEPLPYGRPALEIIREALVARGLSVGTITNSRLYAWSIDIGGGGGGCGGCEALIQGDGSELLVIVDGRGFDTIVAAIAETLNADSRFADVEVLTARGLDERDQLPRATARRT
jgi:hypothetical protein